MQQAMLRVEGLKKKDILLGISFEVTPGEMLAVMGPSGSGKSTLLYNVATLDAPDEGRIWLDGDEIPKLTEDEKADLRLHEIGFVFQQMNMIPGLSILDNILLPALHADKSAKAEKRAQAVALMEKFGIAGLGDRHITEVSGGELQRACICRSIINEPKILFADEPTGALNRSAAEGVMDVLTKVNSAGTTMLIVTHDSRIASRCNRVLYLLDGRIQGETDLSAHAKSDREKREASIEAWLRCV